MFFFFSHWFFVSWHSEYGCLEEIYNILHFRTTLPHFQTVSVLTSWLTHIWLHSTLDSQNLGTLMFAMIAVLLVYFAVFSNKILVNSGFYIHLRLAYNHKFCWKWSGTFSSLHMYLILFSFLCIVFIIAIWERKGR